MPDRRWFTVRMEAGSPPTALAWQAHELQAADDTAHVVSEAVEVELSPEVAAALAEALDKAGPLLERRLAMSVAQHMVAVGLRGAAGAAAKRAAPTAEG